MTKKITVYKHKDSWCWECPRCSARRCWAAGHALAVRDADEHVHWHRITDSSNLPHDMENTPPGGIRRIK